MGEAEPEDKRFYIKWQIEPPFNKFYKTNTLKGIAFTLRGESIKAELTNPTLGKEEFVKKASEVAKKVGEIYTLLDTQLHEVVGLTGRFRFERSSKPALEVIEKGKKTVYGEDASEASFEGSVIDPAAAEDRFQILLDILTLFEAEETPTLRTAISYYNSALAGADQLATAGNLYMAMEELLAKFNPGKKRKKWKWKMVSDNLVQFNPRLSSDNLEALRQLHRGRHAVDDEGRENEPLSLEELASYKRLVREYLLAYVELLREES